MVEKMAQTVRKELSSAKVMVLAIMLSFGVVLCVVSFLVNMLYTLEMVVDIKQLVKSPYDAQMNGYISATAGTVAVMQIVQFLLQFIPFILLAAGVYLIYINSKNYDGKTTGLRLSRGVMKYHAVMSFIQAGLIIVAGVLVTVLPYVFEGKIKEYTGTAEAAMYLKVMSISFLIVFIFVAAFMVVKGLIISGISNSIHYMEGLQTGRIIKKISSVGAVILILAGINSLLNIFSSFGGVGMSNADMKIIEQTLGGQVAQFIAEVLPSKNTQFQVMAVGCAYTFFAGAAQLLAGITMMSIRTKVNKVMEEQEVVNYGGEDFTGSSQC